MDETTAKTGWSLRTDSASGEFRLICQSPKGRSYLIEFEDGAEIVGEPSNPNYWRTIKRGIKKMENNQQIFYKFSIVGIVQPSDLLQDGNQPLKIDVVFPGLFINILPLNVPCTISEVTPHELSGQIGVEIKCHIKPLDK